VLEVLNRIVILAAIIGLLFIVGCRTGEYNVDKRIYAEMPALLTADPDIAENIFYNEDGTPKVTFEKGEMFLWLAYGLDEDTRRNVVSDALTIFHDQYMNAEDNKKKNGTYYREVIGIRGYVEDTELYVIVWDLNEPNPDITNDRYGNFI
jgi:hypothetical protein